MRLVIAILAAAVALGCTPKVDESGASRSAGPSAAAATTAATAAATNIVVTATPRPTATPEATIRKKLGTSVEYTDGWKLTALRSSDQPADRFSTPKPGNRFVVAIVRYDNGTAAVGHFNPFDWKLQDGAGVRRSTAFFTGRDDGLHAGDLAPAGFVSGSLVFEVPSGDTQLLLIYEAFGYKQAIWELF